MMLTANQLASSLGVAVVGALFVALLGAGPQDAGVAVDDRDFISALLGCTWYCSPWRGDSWRGGCRGGRRGEGAVLCWWLPAFWRRDHSAS
ncbi:hypothetical protein ACFV2W_29690 [Streptomyces cellulosae]